MTDDLRPNASRIWTTLTSVISEISQAYPLLDQSVVWSCCGNTAHAALFTKKFVFDVLMEVFGDSWRCSPPKSVATACIILRNVLSEWGPYHGNPAKKGGQHPLPIAMEQTVAVWFSHKQSSKKMIFARGKRLLNEKLGRQWNAPTDRVLVESLYREFIVAFDPARKGGITFFYSDAECSRDENGSSSTEDKALGRKNEYN